MTTIQRETASKRLHPGDRVRAKARTISGWKGTGTVLCVGGNGPDNWVTILKDGEFGKADYASFQLSKFDKTRFAAVPTEQ